MSNLGDRLFRNHHGAVVDFIASRVWATFNLADASIVTGRRCSASPTGEAARSAALRATTPSQQGDDDVHDSGSLAGERVDRSLALLTGLTRSEIADLITQGWCRGQ